MRPFMKLGDFMSRFTKGEMSGRVRGLWGGRRRGTFGKRGQRTTERRGEGEHLCGSLTEDETAGRTDGRTEEQVLLLVHRPDRAEGRAVLYTNMYGEHG